MADFQSYIILFLTWLVSTITIRFIFAKTKSNPRLPPSPFSLPIIGHLHLLGPLPHKAFHKLSTCHGPLMHLRLGSVPCIVVSSPETAKQVLKIHESSFSNRPHFAVVDYLTYGSADFSFAPYGPYWKFMKKLCMSELLGGRTLDSLAPVRQDEMRRFLQSLWTKAAEGKEVDVGGELMRLSNNVISRLTLGKRCAEDEEEAERIRKLVKDVAVLTGTFNVSDYIWFCKNLDLQRLGKRLREVRERFDQMMERMMKEHEENREMEMEGNGDEKVRDLLDILLLKFRDENSEVKLTRENIKAFVLDIFAAGTDASAITTEWALAELINHPNIMEKARQELHTVVGKSRLVEESDIVNLPYLQAIVKETLRLHSSPLIVRESTESCTINGYEIPPKTQLYVNVWAIGRDPNHWKNPLEFEPERFMDKEAGSVSGDLRGQNFQLLPFGSGRRSCPGTTLALLVVQTTLACMVQCFDWKVSGGNGKVDMEEGPGLTLPRAQPLVCVPMACLSPFPTL